MDRFTQKLFHLNILWIYKIGAAQTFSFALALSGNFSLNINHFAPLSNPVQAEIQFGFRVRFVRGEK
jgi:hypothetical protein